MVPKYPLVKTKVALLPPPGEGGEVVKHWLRAYKQKRKQRLWIRALERAADVMRKSSEQITACIPRKNGEPTSRGTAVTGGAKRRGKQ